MSASDSDHDKYINIADINRVARLLDRERTQKHPKDEISIKCWLDDLRKEGANTFCKDRLDQSPPGSQLEEDLFILVLQTKFQLDVFWCLGNWFLGIDGMHNTTCYTGV